MRLVCLESVTVDFVVIERRNIVLYILLVLVSLAEVRVILFPFFDCRLTLVDHDLQLALISIRPPSQLPECYFTLGYHLSIVSRVVINHLTPWLSRSQFEVYRMLDDDHCGYILLSIHPSRLVQVSYLFCWFSGAMGDCYMGIVDSWNRPR